jgi:hypothetical protein
MNDAISRAQALFNDDVIELTVDAMLTATLRTTLGHLVNLRDDFNNHPMRSSTIDVRKVCPNTYGANLLRSIEQTVTYNRLLALIQEMENGVAHRVSQGQF